MSVPDDDFLRRNLIRDGWKQQDSRKTNKYKEDSKSQLLNIVDRKLHTTFIGALAKFEAAFGFLWGDDKDDLSEDDVELLKLLETNGFDKEYWKEIWLETREKILDNGNNQLKALKKEIRNYDISWRRQKIDFRVQKNYHNNHDNHND